MKLLLAALALALVPLRQDETTEPVDNASNAIAAEPASPASVPASIGEVERELEALVRAYPRWLDLRRLQPDPEGPAVSLIVLGERELGDPARRPGLCVLPQLTTADANTSGTLLAVLRSLCEKLESDLTLAERLRKATLYLIPAPLADVFDSEPLPRGVDFAKNFPTDWRPAQSGEAGPYPLSEPECRAIADFLYWRSNLGACLEVSSEAPLEQSLVSVLSVEETRRSREFAETLSRLGAEEPVVFGLETLSAGPGSLRRYADRGLGLWTFLQAPSNAAIADEFRSSEVLIAENSRVAAQTLVERIGALLDALPRIELGAVEVEQLGEALWRVDVPVQNAGRFVTGARHTAEPTARVRLELEGADFVATMVRGASRESFVPLAASGLRVDLGHLLGGETRVLRAIVKTTENTEIELRVRAARAGSVRTKVALPKQ